MVVVVSYDVCTTTKEGRKRLRRVAQACEDYGQRVQFSVFECNVGDKEWAELRLRLLDEYQEDEDSLRFYYLGEDWKRKTEHHGTKGPRDFGEPLLA